MDKRTKIALVTGGSRGLGKDMAIRLAEKGNDVILTYQSQKEKAEEVVAQIGAMGRKSAALPFDAMDIGALDGFVKQIAQTLRVQWGRRPFRFPDQ